jgi:hypothetical protein
VYATSLLSTGYEPRCRLNIDSLTSPEATGDRVLTIDQQNLGPGDRTREIASFHLQQRVDYSFCVDYAPCIVLLETCWPTHLDMTPLSRCSTSSGSLFNVLDAVTSSKAQNKCRLNPLFYSCNTTKIPSRTLYYNHNSEIYKELLPS